MYYQYFRTDLSPKRCFAVTNSQRDSHLPENSWVSSGRRRVSWHSLQMDDEDEDDEDDDEDGIYELWQ